MYEKQNTWNTVLIINLHHIYEKQNTLTKDKMANANECEKKIPNIHLMAH